MPSRREQIRMTAEEIRAYLASQRRMILVTNGPGGLPHAAPMNYGEDEQGRIIMTAFIKSQKVKNLERDPRATLLVESGDAYAEAKAVMLHANAELVFDRDAVSRGLRAIRISDGAAASITASMRDQVDASMSKRVLIRFTPFHAVSWDHSKLAGFY